MISTPVYYWSKVVNVILHTYFSDLTTTCVLWHKDYDLHWPSSVNFNVYIHINPSSLQQSFAKDVYNFTQQDAQFNANGVYYDDLIRKYVAAIEHSKCEGFVVFQDDIPKFAQTFRKASLYSIWRSRRNKFLFIYAKDDQREDYFEDLLFKNMVDILVMEMHFKNSSTFSLKTNKFVGSIYAQPNELVDLTTYDALSGSFNPVMNLFPPSKLQDLQGREIIVAAFSYKPFVVVDFERLPQYYDYAEDNPRHSAHIDGTEIHIVHAFCAIYNCTVQIDTSEKEEWGVIYPNYTSNGLIGMIIEGNAHMAMGAMLLWLAAYKSVDHTDSLGRSGITCLVPAPKRITSWALPLKPFQFTMWLAVLFYLFLEILALLITRHFEETFIEQQQDATWWASIQFGFCTALKLFVSQGTNYIVDSHTVRTVLFATYMMDIIITSIYGGGLSSILTLPFMEEAIDSVQLIYEHNLSWVASSYVWVESIDYPEESESDPILSRLVTNFQIHSLEAMRLMAKSENMGFVVERMTFGHFANSEFITPEAMARLKLMVDDIYFSYTVGLVSRLWPHLPKYNNLISAWISSGLSKFWEWKITADYLNGLLQEQVANSMYATMDGGPVELTMSNFAGLILLWLVGMGASVLVFVGEWLVYWMKLRREKVTVVEI